MTEAKSRPFVDTNVFFSAFYRPGSPPEVILTRHVEATITIVISRQILEEIVSVIREKKPDLLNSLQRFLTNAPPEIYPDPTSDEVRQAIEWINPADAPILAAARKCRADCLISGNTRHFTKEAGRNAGIDIFTPAEYLAQLSND